MTEKNLACAAKKIGLRGVLPPRVWRSTEGAPSEKAYPRRSPRIL